MLPPEIVLVVDLSNDSIADIVHISFPNFLVLKCGTIIRHRGRIFGDTDDDVVRLTY